MRWLSLIFILMSFYAYSHPGRTDSNGCHMDYSVGKQHCGHQAGSGRSESINKIHVYKPEAGDYKPRYSKPVTRTFTKSQLSSEPRVGSSVPGFSRGLFGSGWDPKDGRCGNAKHDALIALSDTKVHYRMGRNCSVASGMWTSLFTDNVITDGKRIDVDHVVPLRWAWDHGAHHWTSDWREKFAADPINLLAVETELNRQKGNKGPEGWLPPANQCQYLLKFMRVVKTYRLTLSKSEKLNFDRVRTRVCS